MCIPGVTTLESICKLDAITLCPDNGLVTNLDNIYGMSVCRDAYGVPAWLQTLLDQVSRGDTIPIPTTDLKFVDFTLQAHTILTTDIPGSGDGWTEDTLSQHMAPGIVLGIVLGTVALLIVVGWWLFWYLRRAKMARRIQSQLSDAAGSSPSDLTAPGR